MLNKKEIKGQNPLATVNGSLYRSKALDCWVYQYYNRDKKRQTLKQRKSETVKEFKMRVARAKEDLRLGRDIKTSAITLR